MSEQTGPLPVVAVVGRPNFGKSTLVNRVLGRRAAVVQDTPGVTRDRIAYEALWNGKRPGLLTHRTAPTVVSASSTTRSTTPSRSRSVLSTTTASSAGRSGLSARLLSYSSRRRRSAASTAISAGSLMPSWPARRWARASGAAVR